MRRLIALALLAGACAAPAEPDAPDASDTSDAGDVTGPRWTASELIAASPVAGLDLVAATDDEGRVQAAFFEKTDGGRYDLVVLGERDGLFEREVAEPGLTGHFGVSLAIDSIGAPAVSYLGGGTADAEGDGRWKSFDTGESLPSDAVVSRRTAAGWQQSIVARLSNSVVTTGFPIDDNGVVTGLWSALAFGADGGLHVAFRDMHFGSDDSASAASNLEYVRPGGGGELVGGGPSDPEHLIGAASYARMVVAEGEPALTFTLGPDSTDDAEQVWFARRGASGWTKTRLSAAAGRTREPPSLAWSPQRGFAVAFLDADEGDLVVARSSDGTSWTTETVEALGETGRHPAVAFAGETLGVLYAFCRGATEPENRCSSRAELRFRTFDGVSWSSSERVAAGVPEASALVVDGAGRFVAVWRDPSSGVRLSRRMP